MGRFREFRRKLAGKVVTYYYNRLYQKARKKADERHEREGEMIYIIDHFIIGQTLSCVNRAEFRFIKHSAQKLHKNPMFWSPLYGVDMLKKTCWYHTADRAGKNALTETDAEIRRLAFIRKGLEAARVLPSKKSVNQH